MADAGTGSQLDMSALEHMARWAGIGVQSGALCAPACIDDL